MLGALQAHHELGDALALGRQLELADLAGIEDGIGEVRTDDLAELMEARSGKPRMQVGGEAQPEAELGIVLEQRVRPGRSATLVVLGPWRRWEVAAVDRGAAGRVGHGCSLAEELGEQL